MTLEPDRSKSGTTDYDAEIFRAALASGRKLATGWIFGSSIISIAGLVSLASGDFAAIFFLAVALLIGVPSISFLRSNAPSTMAVLSRIFNVAIIAYLCATAYDVYRGYINLPVFVVRIIWLTAFAQSRKKSQDFARDLGATVREALAGTSVIPPWHRS